ncbi:MAG: PEP-CTERM sorting domain-containing protein [Planctomycetota bacterium]
MIQRKRHALWAPSVCTALVAMSVPDSYAAFVGVDDFEGYGLLTEVSDAATNPGSNWFQENANVSDQVVLDPAGGTNQVLAFSNFSGGDHALWNDEFNIPAVGGVGTIFLRARLDNASPNLSFGLTDASSPGGFGSLHPQFAFRENATNFQVRDAGSFRTIADIDEDAWYNIWLVVDNDIDESLVYIQSDDDADFATFQQLSVGSPIDFRSDTGPTTDPLSKLLFTSGDADVVFFDDIFFDPTGANLTNPIPENPIPEPASISLIALGLLVAGARRRR